MSIADPTNILAADCTKLFSSPFPVSLFSAQRIHSETVFLTTAAPKPLPGIKAVTPAATYSPTLDVGLKISKPVLPDTRFPTTSLTYWLATPTITLTNQRSPLGSS